MKLLPILAVLLASATPASAANLRYWKCADNVTIDYMYTAAHKVATGRESVNFTIEREGEFLPLVKGRATVTFKVDKTGYHEGVYLNGKRCRETTGQAGDNSPQLTDDDKRALALHPGVPILPPPEYDRPHLLINWLDGLTHEELVAYCNDPKAIWLSQVGCAKPHVSPCKIYLAREEVITAAGLTVNLVKRHMSARCKGWPAP
jgi:hypothetical protein